MFPDRFRWAVASLATVCLASPVFVRAALPPVSGALPADVAGWTDVQKQQQRDAGKNLLSAIAEASKTGRHELAVAKGDYRFKDLTPDPRPLHVLLKGIKDLAIDFQGSTLWFETGANGIVIRDTTGLTLKNVTLDWNPLPFTQGEIVSIDSVKKTVEVKIDPGFEVFTDGMAHPPADVGSGMRGMLFDPKTRLPVEGQSAFSIGYRWLEGKTADDRYTVPVNVWDTTLEKGVRPGQLMAWWRRDGRGIRMENCGRTVLENVTLYATPFIAISEGGGYGGTTYRNVSIIKRPGTGRLMAGNADGINVSNVEKGPLIENCRIDTIGDDFVNINGHFSRVIWQDDPSEVLVSRLAVRDTLAANTPVQFYTRDGMNFIGERRVVKSEMVPYDLTEQNCLSDLKQLWHSGEASGLRYGQKIRAQRLTLDKPLELKSDAMVVSESYVGAGTVIRNNRFERSGARGIRLQSPHTLIENNYLHDTPGQGISLVCHPGFWGEGTNSHDVVIRGNTLDRTCWADRVSTERASIWVDRPGNETAHSYQYNIDIVGNTIKNCTGAGIVVRWAKNLRILDNIIEGHNTKTAYAIDPKHDAARPAGGGHAIIVEASDPAQVRGNTVSGGGPHAVGDVKMIPSTEPGAAR